VIKSKTLEVYETVSSPEGCVETFEALLQHPKTVTLLKALHYAALESQQDGVTLREKMAIDRETRAELEERGE
jgi:hypothetical protein